MKKFFTAAFLLFLCFAVFAQEEEEGLVSSGGEAVKPGAIGLGLEWNMNSRDNFAGGASLGFDYGFAGSFAAGINFTVSSNFSGITVLEPAAMFRMFFLSRDYTGLFAQADIGAFVVLEDGHVIPKFLGGLRGGFRLPLGAFYIEPFGRVGYPFMFGVGAQFGFRF